MLDHLHTKNCLLFNTKKQNTTNFLKAIVLFKHLLLFYISNHRQVLRQLVTPNTFKSIYFRSSQLIINTNSLLYEIIY